MHKKPAAWLITQGSRTFVQTDAEFLRSSYDCAVMTPLYAVEPGESADALDAARYRRIRQGQHWSVIDGIGDALRADALDAAIDAAMARESAAIGGAR